MNISYCEQQSHEWWQLKVGKIGGTRFGQVLSTRENRLVYELMDEILSGTCNIADEYISDDMQYGIDNEPVAIKLYEQHTGNKVEKVGIIHGDLYPSIHVASPDGLVNGRIAVEVKCTQYGYTHLQRIFDGVDSKYIPQCVNYFAVSKEIDEVHFVSYCGTRTERPLHIIKMVRGDYEKEILKGLSKIPIIETELKTKIEHYSF